MKKDNRIIPVGLKGNQINERMKELMGITSINENVSTSNVELTKVGPDGNAYAIVRENHNYFIKSTNKKQNLVKEDFKYIGGYMNRVAYPSYEKAIKHLNLKFNSLAESLDAGHNINVFENDNLLNENGFAGGFANHPKGGGFSGEGNLHGNTPLYTEESEVSDEPFISHGSYTVSNSGGYEIMLSNSGDAARVRDAFGGDNPETSDWLPIEYVNNEDGAVDSEGYPESEPVIDPNGYNIPLNMVMINNHMNENEYCSDDVELTETEQAIEDMGKDEMPSNESDPNEQPGSITEHKLSIKRALEQMDTIIDTLSEGKVKKKVYTIK
jgi:hypothetical protein